jgi:hypothetical protein
MVWDQFRQRAWALIWKISKVKRARGKVQLIEHLSSKCETSVQTPVIPKSKNWGYEVPKFCSAHWFYTNGKPSYGFIFKWCYFICKITWMLLLYVSMKKLSFLRNNGNLFHIFNHFTLILEHEILKRVKAEY